MIAPDPPTEISPEVVIFDVASVFVDDVNVNKTLVKEGHAWEYYGGKR